MVHRSAPAELAEILAAPEVLGLIADLEATRWTGRRGYPIRAMVGMTLVKGLYSIPVWTRTTGLVAEHAWLQAVLGCAPSVDACYRFAAKLRKHSKTLAECVECTEAALRERFPDMGRDIAIDGSDLPAYANGQRYVSKGGKEREKFSDPDASWGHRSAVSTRKGGGYYGYKIHAAVCVITGLPVAWTVETARAAETSFALGLIDTARQRGFDVKTAIMDKGYDNEPIHAGCMDRDISPVTPLRRTARVKRGEHKPPTCEHGEWTFAGADMKRKRTKWRCPTGACSPASVWVKADRLHPLIPRDTARSRKLYRLARRRGARVRTAQARVGSAPAARSRPRSRAAPRRLDDPREAVKRTRPLASRAGRARRVAAAFPSSE